MILMATQLLPLFGQPGKGCVTKVPDLF